jgi:hypothetical protein
MPTRSNATCEVTRLWLQSRHGYLVRESLPVPVKYALSDIDLVAMHPNEQPLQLPNGSSIGPRLIVETKDEHDWEATGKEFGKLLRADMQKMKGQPFIPEYEKGTKFTMLREQHYRRATELFGTDVFDRLFVVHAIDRTVLDEHAVAFKAARIHWLTIRELMSDLYTWYGRHPRATELRNELVGDVFHLLVGFCGFCLPVSPETTRRE